MRVAGFDIGTNSVRVLIADADGTGRIRPGVRIGFATRLGEGLAHTGRVSDEALERNARVLGKSARLARALGTSSMKAGATHVLRVAANAQQVLKTLEKAAELPIRILSQDEEAYYAYLGVFSGEEGAAGRAVGQTDPRPAGTDKKPGGQPLAIDEKARGRSFEIREAAGSCRMAQQGTVGAGTGREEERRLLMDVGGGSVTMTQGQGFNITGSTTLPIGCVTLTEKFLKHDPPTEQEMRTLREHVQAELRFVSTLVTPGDSVVAIGGAATCMAAVSLELPFFDYKRVEGHILGLEEMERSAAMLSHMTVSERERVGCLGRRRAEIAVAGAVLLSSLTEHLGLHALVVSIRGLRYGLALEAATS